MTTNPQTVNALRVLLATLEQPTAPLNQQAEKVLNTQRLLAKFESSGNGNCGMALKLKAELAELGSPVTSLPTAPSAPEAPRATISELQARVKAIASASTPIESAIAQTVRATMSKPLTLEQEWAGMDPTAKREFFNSFRTFCAFRRHPSAITEHGRVHANGDSKFIARNDDEDDGHGRQLATTEAGLGAEFAMLSPAEKADFGSVDRYVALRKRELCGQIQIFGERR